MTEETKRRELKPIDIDKTHLREASTGPTPPHTGMKDKHLAQVASTPPLTPFTPGLRQIIDETLSVEEALADVPLEYIQKTLIQLGTRFYNNPKNCAAFVKAIPEGSLENVSEEYKNMKDSYPIHLEYAVHRVPYIAQMIKHADPGDLLLIPMPHHTLWPAMVTWIYTDCVVKEACCKEFDELFEFLTK